MTGDIRDITEQKLQQFYMQDTDILNNPVYTIYSTD
jgi:hypothetical protein